MSTFFSLMSYTGSAISLGARFVFRCFAVIGLIALGFMVPLVPFLVGLAIAGVALYWVLRLVKRRAKIRSSVWLSGILTSAGMLLAGIIYGAGAFKH